ncbi:MAG: hypothetical protein QXX84_02530 [Sulfolobales archaeon]|nr:hypothetical protein [Sulfolobales archaeon]
MGSVIVSAKIRGSRGETVLRALVDPGFYGDLITLPKDIENLGIELKYKRIQRLSSGEAIEVDTVAEK